MVRGFLLGGSGDLEQPVAVSLRDCLYLALQVQPDCVINVPFLECSASLVGVASEAWLTDQPTHLVGSHREPPKTESA